MNKQKVIILIIIAFFVLAPRSVFSISAPIETVEWRNDFSQKWIIDESRSTIFWERGAVKLKQSGEEYVSSGVLWTDEIRFRNDIYSLTIEGNYYEPENTRIIPSVRFKNNTKEHVLHWGSTYFPDDAARNLYLKIFLGTNDSDVSPVLNDIRLIVETQDQSEWGIISRDRNRVNDLKNARDTLKTYYADFGHYPIVTIDANEKENQWRLLRDILESASIHYRNNYTSRFPSQPKADDTHQYGYLTNASGSYFLLWTALENMSAEQSLESYKGEVLHVLCDKEVYCISSKTNVVNSIIRNFESDLTSAIDYIQGVDFIKQADDPRVYLVTEGSRVWVRTPQIFEKVGGIWENIKTFVSQIQTPSIKFVKTKDSSAVYLVTPNGFKRSMLNERVLASYGNLSEIITTHKDIINALPDNYLIRAKGDTRVYFLSEKIKRWITTPLVLEKLGFSFEEVVEIDPMELDIYPEGNPIF